MKPSTNDPKDQENPTDNLSWRSHAKKESNTSFKIQRDASSMRQKADQAERKEPILNKSLFIKSEQGHIGQLYLKFNNI